MNLLAFFLLGSHSKCVTPGSFVRLGFYFASRLVVRALTRHRGLARFEANYCREDRLLPVGEDDKRHLAVLSSCIGCGLCDVAFEPSASNAFQLPSALPQSFTRSLPDYDAAISYLATLSEGNLDALEAICPAQIPFREIASFVQGRAQRIRDSLPPPG